MATGNGIERTLGQLLEAVKDVRGDIERLESKSDTRLESLDRRIADVEGHINRQKGGWFAIVGLTGMAGTLGGVVAKFWPHGG